MRHSNKESKDAKIKALLEEGDEWESGKRGMESRAVTPAEEEAINQKLDLQMISIRLPVQAVEELKKRAARNGIGYQPYLRQLVMEHLKGPSIEERVSRIEQRLQKLG